MLVARTLTFASSTPRNGGTPVNLGDTLEAAGVEEFAKLSVVLQASSTNPGGLTAASITIAP